jgi:two-component system nitrate/nitrite response regulator NarL
MLLQDRRTESSSAARVLPSTQTALAADLAGLLERLGVEAVILDAQASPLAQTPGALEALAGLTPADVRHVEVQVCGQKLRVAMRTAQTRSSLLDLTPRQRVVVEMIAEGLRNREIAERLGISLHTVRRHVEALLRRLNVPTRAAAAVALQRAVQQIGGRQPLRAA